MNSVIHFINQSEYQDVLAVWEASVRATHHFLTEEDIKYFKPLILYTYLDAVELLTTVRTVFFMPTFYNFQKITR